MRLSAVQHRQPGAARPRAMPVKPAGYRLQRRRRVTEQAPHREFSCQHRCRWRSSGLCVTPRSHLIGARQPRHGSSRCGATRACRNWLQNPATDQRPAEGKSTPSVQSCCRGFCDAKRPSAPRRGTSIATVKSGAMSSLVRPPVDAATHFVVNYRLPWAPSARCLCAGRGVAVVTCLRSPGPEPARSPPWRWWPRSPPS